MTTTVLEAQTILPELVQRARSGEEVILISADSHEPAIRFEVIQEPSPVPKVRRLGLLFNPDFKLPDDFFDPLPEEELRLWEGDGE